jgi:chemotaxis protein histidine kinase CheA
MQSFKQHIEVEDEDLNKNSSKPIDPAKPIDEATAGDLLIGLGAAGGLLAMKKAWDTFGKGTKLQAKLHALNPFQTQKDKAAVAKDIEDKRKGDVEDAKAILGDPGASEKDKAKAQKTIDKKQTDDEKETDATADKEKGEKERIKRGDLTDTEKAQKKIDDADKASKDAETRASADELGGVKDQAAADKFFKKHKRAPKGYQQYPDDSGKVLPTGEVETLKAKAEKDKKDAEEKAAKDKEKADAEIEADKENERRKEADANEKKRKEQEAEAEKEKNKTQNTSYKPEGNMTITESNELQAIMALDDEGIKAEINRKGEVVVKKRDLKKAEKALKKSFRKGGQPKLVGEDVELDEGLKPLDKSVIDAFYYKKEKAGKLVSTDGDSLEKNGMGGGTIAQWLDPSGKIAIGTHVDSKSTESILKYMKKSIPKGNFDKISYKKYFGEEVQRPRSAYEVVSKARNKITEAIDRHAAVELYNFMQNERDLQRQKDSIIKNIVRKKKSGKYDHSKAPKLWEYWVENGAKAYDKLYSSPGAKTFDKDTRGSVAIQFANEYNAEIDLGNYS